MYLLNNIKFNFYLNISLKKLLFENKKKCYSTRKEENIKLSNKLNNLIKIVPRQDFGRLCFAI